MGAPVELMLILAVLCIVVAVGAMALQRTRSRRPAAGSSTTTSGAGAWRYVERASWVVGIFGGVLGLATIAASLRQDEAGGGGGSPDEPGSPSVLVEDDSYRLVPSDFFSSNDEDKVDLDTGEPGYGSSSILVGEAREGGPAELILENDQVHTGHDAVDYALVADPAPSHGACAEALADGANLTQGIDLDDLRVGSAFCVRTNDGNIARVQVRELSLDDVEMTVAFRTWRS